MKEWKRNSMALTVIFNYRRCGMIPTALRLNLHPVRTELDCIYVHRALTADW
jgi:hypothetical protein